MVAHGCVEEQVAPLPCVDDTNAPLTVSGPGMHVFVLHSKKPVLHANPH